MLIEKLKSDVKQIQVICDYLINECKHDDNLGQRILLDSKSVDGMYQYILTAVKNNYKKQIVNRGVMVSDEDVFNFAIHYFIEDDETLKKEYSNNVSKAEIKKNTMPVEKMKEQVILKKEKKEKTPSKQISLFDLGVEG